MVQSSSKPPENSTAAAPTDTPNVEPTPQNPISRMKRRYSKFRIPKTVYALEKKLTTWYWEPTWVKICAILLLIVVGTFLVLGLSCSDWFIASASGFRQGLFVYCIDENATAELPRTVLNETEGCHWMDMSFQDYSTWAFVAGWISVFVCLLATIVLIIMYANKDLASKFYLGLSSALLLFLAVLIGGATLALAFLEFIVISADESFIWTYGSAFWITCAGVILMIILLLFVLWTCCCISRELPNSVDAKPVLPTKPAKINVTSLSATQSTAVKQDDKSNYVAATAKIGKNVTIGEKCVICPGVVIGDNVIIGAGSVVAADIPSNSIVGGDPATIVPYSDNQKIFVQS